MSKIIAVGLAVMTFFLVCGLVINAVDYGFNAIAVITGDPSWNTRSYQNDRFMNAVRIRTEFSPSNGQGSYLHVTIDNASDVSKEVTGTISCESPYSKHTLIQSIPSGWYVEANSSASYTVGVKDYDGTSYGLDDFPSGPIPCELAI